MKWIRSFQLRAKRIFSPDSGTRLRLTPSELVRKQPATAPPTAAPLDSRGDLGRNCTSNHHPEPSEGVSAMWGITDRRHFIKHAAAFSAFSLTAEGFLTQLRAQAPTLK